MSANLYAWEPSLQFDPKTENFVDWLDRFSDLETRVAPTKTIQAFVKALLERYHDLTNKNDGIDSVWAFGPLMSGASGSFIDVAIVWNRYEEVRLFFIQTANDMGLNVYDPQNNCLFPITSNKITDWF